MDQESDHTSYMDHSDITNPCVNWAMDTLCTFSWHMYTQDIRIHTHSRQAVRNCRNAEILLTPDKLIQSFELVKNVPTCSNTHQTHIPVSLQTQQFKEHPTIQSQYRDRLKSKLEASTKTEKSGLKSQFEANQLSPHLDCQNRPGDG